MQPILPVTVPVSKIKDAACQRCGDGDGSFGVSGTFNIFDVTYKQRRRTALNPILNGTKKGDIYVTCKRSFREVYGILLV